MAQLTPHYEKILQLINVLATKENKVSDIQTLREISKLLQKLANAQAEEETGQPQEINEPVFGNNPLGNTLQQSFQEATNAYKQMREGGRRG